MDARFSVLVPTKVLSLSISLIVFESCLDPRCLTGTDTLTFLVKCSFIIILSDKFSTTSAITEQNTTGKVQRHQ
ncbi:hypothetical protein EV424DRAFT_1424313 [Suillus variegatus]|nr:hypothetical protein EV424DRAFT_1424313 [Suillus variegatus]